MKKLKVGQKRVKGKIVLKTGYKYLKGGRIVKAKKTKTRTSISRAKCCTRAGRSLNTCKYGR